MQPDKLNSVKLGTTANLILGLKASWNPTEDNPFFGPADEGLMTETPNIIPNENAKWSYPEITLHDTPESLLSYLYEINIKSESDENPVAHYPAGALILDDADRAKSINVLKSQLGIDFSVLGRGYALIKIRKDVGFDVHKAFSRGIFGYKSPNDILTRAFQKDISKLRPSLRTQNSDATVISQYDAQDYINFFKKYGTHFVSKVFAGDIIYQVFSYDSQDFKTIKTAMAEHPDQFSGAMAFAFSYYTRPKNEQGYGNVIEKGSLNILSGDSTFYSSVKDGAWKDSKWALGDSILAPWLNSSVDLKKYNAITITGVEISSLSLFAEYYRRMNWRKVFKAAMYVKHRDNITPGFTNGNQPNFDSVYGTDSSYLSTISTPYINIYKTRQDISNINLVAAKTVKSFSLFTNLLEVSEEKKVSLPGNDVTIAAYTISGGNTGANPSTLVLSDSAYESYFITCKQMYGELIVANASGTKHHLLANGVQYEVSGKDDVSGRFIVSAKASLQRKLDDEKLQTFFTSLQFAITGAETIMNASICSNSQENINIITGFLNWITEIIPKESKDVDLHKIRLSALYISKGVQNLSSAARHVPYLTYTTYQPLINSIIQVTDQIALTMSDYQKQINERKTQELIIDTAKNLNENIIQTGTLLKDYINATAKQQEDLSDYYEQLSDMDDKEIAKNAASIKELTTLFNRQQDTVNLSVEKYKTAVYEWQTMEIVKFSLELAKGMFTLGTAIAAPEEAPDAVKKLGEMAVKIKQFMGIMAAMAELGQSIQGGLSKITSAEDAFESLNTASTNFPTALEWSEFLINYKLALSDGPDISEKNQLISDVEILCLRAQALLNAQANQKKMIGERFTKQLQLDMSDRQKERLQKLDKVLKPKDIKNLDTVSIDLIGLTGELEFKQQQMAMILAKTIMTQDLALQYEYLQQPMPMTSFDILSLKYAIFKQNLATIRALEELSIIPQAISEPIEYVIEGVPAASLLNGNTFRFTIPLSAKEFIPYTMVRVDKVTANIEGVNGTESGHYIVNLLYLGTPFEDRDQNRNPLCFNTVSRNFKYLYNTASKKAAFGNTGTFEDKYSKITPFSEWEISFPNTSTNKGITFDKANLKITLSFNITAQLNDAKSLLSSNLNDAATVTKDSVLKEMYNRSVLRGWDVVFNYTEENINKLLLDQYTDRKNNPQFAYTIPETTSDVVAPDTGVITRTKWSMTLDAPRIQFLSNNSQYCEVYMDILGGNYEYGIVVNGVYTKITEQPLKKGDHIKANVKLEKMTGNVSTQYSVAVNLSSGAFDTQGLEITVPNPLFDGIVTEYFKNLSVKYVIGTLDLANHSTLEAMTPKTFFFHVLSTSSNKNILQLFIATDKADPTKLSPSGIDIAEPIPDNFGCSLIVSSRILFDKIMQQGFEKENTTFSTKAIDPANSFTAWQAEVSSGSIQGTFISSNKNIRISKNSNKVVVDMSGMSFVPDGKTFGLLMSYSKTEKRDFEYYTRHSYYSAGEAWDTYSWDAHSLDVNISLSGILPIAILGTGQEQKVQILAPTSSININGSLASGGACSCNDRQLQQEFLAQLQAQLPKLICEQVDVPFKSVSLFALKNLLFPSQNIVDMKAAYAPGDLIIFGNFTK